MFSYVFMKILEGRPRSYDERMHALSGGRLLEAKRAAVAALVPSSHVLEIGSGAGDCSYDAVISTLEFSELGPDERRFALENAARVLKPGGLLVIADEVVPRKRTRRLAHSLVRAPMFALTYLASGSSTTPLAQLPDELAAAGFTLDSEQRTMRTDLLNGYRKLSIAQERCEAGKDCTEVCPLQVWGCDEEQRAVLARIEDCTACTACVMQSKSGAIKAAKVS